MPVQVTEERLSERRAEGVVWVKETNLVRSLIREAEWGVKDASGTFVPVVAGQDAGGSFMQSTGKDLAKEESCCTCVCAQQMPAAAAAAGTCVPCSASGTGESILNAL